MSADTTTSSSPPGARRHRRVRYRGAHRNRLWLSLRVAAVNLRRLLNLGLHRTDAGWAVA